MITVAQAQAEIERRASLLPAETIAAAEARQRILRETISCLEDMPPFDRSAMDGYALRVDDEAECWTVRGEIQAGQSIDAETRPGEAWRIFTGARLPGPDLKVVMQENVEEKDGRIRLTRSAKDRMFVCAERMRRRASHCWRAALSLIRRPWDCLLRWENPR